MKKIFLLFFLFISYFCNAQYRGSNWAISDSILIHFSSGGNTVSTSAIHSTDYPNEGNEAIATISDEAGNLLFYTNGYTVWNKNNNVMANGDSLQCNYSVTNGVITIPCPNKDSIYAIFYINEIVGSFIQGFSYSLVNVKLNNGLGAITKKNIPLLKNTFLAEKVSVVKDGNGIDWWLITHDETSSTFYKFLVTTDSVYGPYLQNIGYPHKRRFQGEICFSPDGNRLGMVVGNLLEIFDFNRCTGELTNELLLDSLISTSYYGCSFSASGNRFYAANFNNNIHSNIYQFDLDNANPNLSKTLIWTDPYYPNNKLDSTYVIGQFELAPDNKIYIVLGFASIPDTKHYSFQNMNLSVINQPDSLGLKCNFKPYSFYLGGHRTTIGLPNMPNYNLGKLTGSECDTLFDGVNNKAASSNSVVSVYPNPCSEQLTVSREQLTNAEIEIKDLLGRTVLEVPLLKEVELLSGRQTIDVTGFAEGLYFIIIKSGSKAEIRKLVVQH